MGGDVQYVLGPDSLARLMAADGFTFSQTDLLSELYAANVAPYADNAVTYFPADSSFDLISWKQFYSRGIGFQPVATSQILGKENGGKERQPASRPAASLLRFQVLDGFQQHAVRHFVAGGARSAAERGQFVVLLPTQEPLALGVFDGQVVTLVG